MADVCVIGAGPAGCVFAARMAQLGHSVSVVERARFPRSRLGESLTPGVAPLLRSAGFAGCLEHRVLRGRNVRIAWADGVQIREHPREDAGMSVERGTFDQQLLEETRAFGVRVFQPATIMGRMLTEGRWRLKLAAHGDLVEVESDFLCEAGGRSASRADCEQTGPSTIAIYRYWRSGDCPPEPVVEAGRSAWFWGVPLPGGVTNTLAFVEPKAFARLTGSLPERFMQLIAETKFAAGRGGYTAAGPVGAIDATPYLSTQSVSENAIRVGDAALAVDPLSSSGVQKAIQSALAAAIVANTLLRKPERKKAAFGFYRTSLKEASDRHRKWAAEHYAAVAAKRDDPFWVERAANAKPGSSGARTRAAVDVRLMVSAPVTLADDVEIISLPCLEDEFVGVADAVSAPGLERPVAFLAGQALAPLLRDLPPHDAPLQIAHRWTDRIPLESGLAIAAWLVHHGVLAPTSATGEGRHG